MWNPICWRWN